MLGLLITVVGLVVDRGRGMVGRCMMDSMVDNWGMVDNWSMVDGMMGNNRGGMYCMVHSRSMMGNMSTKSCEGNSRATSNKRDKSNQSKDLHDVVV